MVPVTILVPNYKTPSLTKLCLRLIRKYTDPQLAKIIVIDNDSQDESLSYLKSLSWITLLERKHELNESPALSHARALDLGLSVVNTPYVLSIHTDTLVKHSGWINFLLQQIQVSSDVAGVGSWKLEKKPWFVQVLKHLEHRLQSLYFRYTKKSDHALEGVGKNFYYLRSHCALYRMDLLRKFNLTFSEDEWGVHAGKTMHKRLVDQEYKMIFIPSKVLLTYLAHINHATMVLNPELGSKTHTIKKGLVRIEKQLLEFDAREILLNADLDK